jgi:hypothetical protein
MEMRGAELVLLVAAKVGGISVCSVFVGQPFTVMGDWSEQTVALVPDPEQWKCLGARHDRTDDYGWGEISDVLRDLNGNVIFVLYPLDIVPAEHVDGNPHLLKAGEEYAVDRSRLPEGCVMLDEVRIEFHWPCDDISDRVE